MERDGLPVTVKPEFYEEFKPKGSLNHATSRMSVGSNIHSVDSVEDLSRRGSVDDENYGVRLLPIDGLSSCALRQNH